MADINEINFKGKTALIRVDFNVPLDDQFAVTDDTRIRSSVPTILKVLKEGGSVVLMSHLGRPKGDVQDKFSLRHVVSCLTNLIDNEVIMADSCVSESDYELSRNLKPGQVLLLENLRFYAEETDGNVEFAEALSKHGDIYINDAFGTAHRAHASTSIIAKFYTSKNKCFGLLMAEEIASLRKALSEGERPICAVVGGAKVSSKIDILTSLMNKVNKIVVGGGMAYTFVKANGGNVGNSLVEDDKLDLARDLQQKANSLGVDLILPVDSVNSIEFANKSADSTTGITDIPANQMGLDIGPRSIEIFTLELLNSKTIIWNGPMGVFEFDAFQQGTELVGQAIVGATKNGAFSLVGGGDSVAAARKYSLDSGVSYVSTGGGAMLEYLEGKILPGIEAIGE